MSVPHPRSGTLTPPALTDEEERAAIAKAMEGDWDEDQELLGTGEFDDPDDLEEPNLEADPE